ncbi:MAG: MoaD/ThiS family protein [Anaerolineae bacterium]|nr:MoaD/ThiS family protein [Anaerolineae bacterium]MDW8070379.1 MoaD/ThiS family protein [Anaerolineae bacterium]
MKVRVKLYATLVDLVPQSVRARMPEMRPARPFEHELPEGSTLADLVNQLALPPAEIKAIFVNGRAQPLDYVLRPGDEVGVFPPVGGG